MFARVLVFSLGATLVLTSCSTVAALTDLPKATATYMALSPAEAKAQFETIANASCDKAMAEGVVEQSIASDGFTLVMVPKEVLIKTRAKYPN